MGKQDFNQIYQEAIAHLGERPTIKLSDFCDRSSPYSNFAGMIIYHTYGTHQWQQRPGQGLAGGYRGRSFYVLILCTDNWPEYALQAAGQGRVHDYLYRQYFNMEYSNERTCCGGFGVLRGTSVYSSVYLNEQSGDVRGLRWQSDGSKYMSGVERSVVNVAISQWRHRGPGAVVHIQDNLHAKLMSAPVPRSPCSDPYYDSDSYSDPYTDPY